ncbi:MAG: glycosyltransferase family 4 protein [Patescibacteria group bacterium]
MTTLIAGYAYVRENFFATFRHYPEKENLYFLLPKSWKIKGGKVIYHPPSDPNVFTANAYFHHSRYPVIGGLLKGWLPAFPLVAWRLKRNQQLRLVYTPSEPILLTTLYQALWAKLFGLKHVFFSWENIPYRQKLKGLKGALQKVVLKLNIALSDGIICGNSKCLEIFSALTQKPLVQIPLSGLDMDYFSSQSGAKRFRDLDLENKLVFTFVGAIGIRKGINLMVEAFKAVLAEFPHSFLIIAGSGEGEREIETLIEKHNLGEKIIRHSWLNHKELKELLNASDVFLYPSLPYQGWEEQFGYAMAEASLMKLPVISTFSGSITDVVKDNQTGILVEPNDSQALQRAMFKLASDEGLRRKLGRAGRQFIAENFSQRVIAEKFHNFFRRFQ